MPDRCLRLTSFTLDHRYLVASNSIHVHCVLTRTSLCSRVSNLLWCEFNALDQLLESWVRAQAVQQRIILHSWHPGAAVVVGLFQPLERLILLARPNTQPC